MNIAILGYGVEGESVYKYYRAKYPDALFTVYDNKPEPKNTLPDDVKFVGGVHDFRGITADLAIKTPAIPPWKVAVSGQVTTMAREFMKMCPAPIIGVTGTKGKGTTCSLIKSILDADGRKAWLVGNIGVGALDVIDQIGPDDIVVYELSSFQLWDCDSSPHVAVVLGIEPEHLDVHKDLDDYIEAKSHIAAYQSDDDIVVYKADNQFAVDIARRSSGNPVGYQRQEGAHVEGDTFYYGGQKLCSLSMLRLPGRYNQDNACAAIEAVRPWVKDGITIGQGLAAFEGLPHRLQLVKSVNDVAYYDDSVGTTPGSAIAALSSFDQQKVIILGGYDKGASYEELAKVMKEQDSTIRQAILIGHEATAIERALRGVGFSRYDNIGMNVSMTDIVNKAAQYARPGDVVLLSPACASFDMFKNVYDRGDQFIQAVEKL